MSSSSLVLITGGNGFVGYAVLAGALEAGYLVRAAVRRQDGIDAISRAPSIQKYLHTGALTFTIVPDNAKPDAYRQAANGCSYVIHVASPLATQPGDLVSQAIAGTKAILEAAEATPTVKRVVFTSSIAAIRPYERLLPDHPANQAVMSGKSDQVPTMTADTKVPTQPPVTNEAPGFKRYVDSKIAASNLVDEYVANNRPESAHFSVINLQPGWVLGPEELARNKGEAFKGSNLCLGWLFFDVDLTPLVGEVAGGHPPLLAESVHLDDVVDCHVKALDTDKMPGKHRNFLLCSGSPTGPAWMDAVDIIRKQLPQEVAEGKIPFAAKIDTVLSKFDATPTERDLLGRPFKPFEEQVKDTIKWYVHLDD